MFDRKFLRAQRLEYAELLIEAGKVIMDEPQDDSYVVSYLHQFAEIHLRRLCDIIMLDPSKTTHICRIVGAHCSDSVNSRIQMLKTMKDYLTENQQALTYCFAKMLELEPAYNDFLFDIYMYYAMSGLSCPSPVVRVAALRMLNIMAEYNYELAFNLVDKLVPLMNDEYWEVKVQLYILACELLKKVEAQQSALKAEDMPSTATKDKAQSEKNIFKSKVDMLYRIIDECVDEHSSLLVIKIAIFHIIPLLGSYKKLYGKIIALMLILPNEMLTGILDAQGEFIGEEGVVYTYSSYVWLYPCKCRAAELDKLLIMRSLADYISETKPESLEQRHYQILALCAKKQQYPSEAEGWYKIFKLLHEYIFLGLADTELCDTSLALLNRFFTVPNYQEAMFSVFSI